MIFALSTGKTAYNSTTGYTFLDIAGQASNIKSTYRRQVTSKICISSSDITF